MGRSPPIGFGGLLNVRLGSSACHRMHAKLESVLRRQLSMTGAVFRGVFARLHRKAAWVRASREEAGNCFFNETLA
jgi:hypothetical protein